MADQLIGFNITADASGLTAAVAQAQSTMERFFAEVTTQTEAMGASLESVQSKITSAFNFGGAAVGLELMQRLTESFSELGARAQEMRKGSDILGVTTSQFQAMQTAAEEAGVGSDALTHAGERLVTMLTQARDGSAAAIDKLHALGVTTAEIQDPTFNVNGLLQILHDRLNDAATAQDTMNQLVTSFGTRAAEAAEAIKHYDGTAAGVAATMAKINGLTKEQIADLSEAKAVWEEFTTKLENSAAKALVAARAAGQWVQQHTALGQAVGNLMGASDSSGQASQAQAAAAQLAQQQEQAARNIQVLHEKQLTDELQQIKQSVEAFQQGSDQRLAALRQEAAITRELYGANADATRKADTAVIAEQRVNTQEHLRAFEEQTAALKRYGDLELATTEKIIADDKAQLAEFEKDAKEQARIGQQAAQSILDTQLSTLAQQDSKLKSSYAQHQLSAQQEYNQEVQLLAQKLADQEAYFAKLRTLYAGDAVELAKIGTEESKAKDQFNTGMLKAQETLSQQIKAQWASIASAVESSFSSSIAGMLRGTETFAQAISSMTTSILSAFISMGTKMAASWLENLLLQKTEQKITTAAGVADNAGLAASGAMASVASIPITGWAMAPAVGAETFAEAMSYASAAGGYDIPHGTNPVTQLHAREMVLPSDISDHIRASMGAAASGAGRSGTLKVKNVGGGMYLGSHADLAKAVRELGLKFML